MNVITLQIYIIILCIIDYVLTIIGLQMGHVVEFNPIFCIIFEYRQYTLGLIFKVLLTWICIQILNEKILWYVLCLYLSVNSIHIIYMLLEIGLRIC